MLPVIALALVACVNESPRDAAPPPASFIPAPSGPSVAPLPPEDDPGEDCAVPPPTDEAVADGEDLVGSSEPMENIAPTPDDEWVDDCLPPEDFDDETAKLEPGRVQLTVSNQSFEEPTIHLTIKLDGEIVADDDFEVGTQHNWVTFDVDSLAPGEHTITAESSTGVTLTETFELPETEGLYLLLDYFTDGAGGFNFMELEGPFMSA